MSRSSGRGPKRCPAKLRPEAACTVQLLFSALVLTSEDVVATVLDCDKQSLRQTCQTAANDRGNDPEMGPCTDLLTTRLLSCALLSDMQAMVTQRTAV